MLTPTSYFFADLSELILSSSSFPPWKLFRHVPRNVPKREEGPTGIVPPSAKASSRWNPAKPETRQPPKEWMAGEILPALNILLSLFDWSRDEKTKRPRGGKREKEKGTEDGTKSTFPLSLFLALFFLFLRPLSDIIYASSVDYTSPY